MKAVGWGNMQVLIVKDINFRDRAHGAARARLRRWPVIIALALLAVSQHQLGETAQFSRYAGAVANIAFVTPAYAGGDDAGEFDKQMREQAREAEKQARDAAEKAKKEAADKLKDVFHFPH